MKIKEIGAWGGCLLRCLLNTPWNSRLMILFDKSAKKRLSQWQHPCCVRRWEGDRNLFQAGIFYFARLALRWTLIQWQPNIQARTLFQEIHCTVKPNLHVQPPLIATTSHENWTTYTKHQKFPCQTNTYCTVGNSHKQPPSVSDSDHILGLTNFPLFLTFCRQPLCTWSDLYVCCMNYNGGQNS